MQISFQQAAQARIGDAGSNIAGLLPGPKSRVRAGIGWLRSLVVALLLLSPTIFAVGYYGFTATPRYMSEAQFVVRNANRQQGQGLSTLLQLVGIAKSQDDSYAVHDFIASRDAVVQASARIPLAEIYGRPEADWLAIYPNPIYGGSVDEFHKYLKSRIRVIYNSNTGISTLEVEAFRPEDAALVATTMLELGERVINRMNERIREDTVKFATDEVRRAEQRVLATQLAITNFRNREIMVDPNISSVHVLELIARLSSDLTNQMALIAETAAASPSSPQLPGLERRAQAIRSQIAMERARITDGSDGLAQKIAHFEYLMLEREFANKTLGAAISALDLARGEARRQQLYLERVAGPTQPDVPLRPKRLTQTITVAALNLIAIMVAWLILSGLREHRPRREE